MSNPLIQRDQPTSRSAYTPVREQAPMRKELAAPPPLPKARRKAAKPITAKALIAAASVAITLSGWALFAVQEAPTSQGTQAVAYAQAADSSVVDTTHALDGLRKVTLPAAANVPQNNTTSSTNLRVVTAPTISNSATNNTGSGASVNRTTLQPRLRIRTRSSR